MLLRTFQEFLTEGKLRVHNVMHKGQHIGTVWHSKGVVAGEHIHGARFSDMSGSRNKKERMGAIALRMAKHHDSLVKKEEKEPKSLMFSIHDKGRRCPECGKAKGLKHKADCSKRKKVTKEEFLPEAKWSTPAKRKYDPFCDCQVYQISPCETCQKQHKKHGVKDEYDRAGHERARSIEQKKWYKAAVKKEEYKPLKESVYVVKAVHRQTGETKKFPVRALMKRAPHIHMRDIKAKVAKVFDNHEITVEPHNAI